jgi:sulfate adenylyltransferase
LMGTMKVVEKYAIDKKHEAKQVFRTTDQAHPGVSKVMSQEEVNLAGPVKVFSELHYPQEYGNRYLRPKESRQVFEKKGWSTVAALQLRNPMHRAHEHLAKIAVEICDGVFIHQLVGKLKEGDIPADVRVKAIDVLIEHYFVKDTCIQGVYPMEMRYGGPREALLHGVFRQNYGCSHLLVGRDHAGVGDYYGPYDAQHIFDEIPKGALLLQPLKIDLTFYCRKCDGMASTKTCPHDKNERVILSGTMLRKMLSEDQEVPDHFSRPEVLEILKEYYATLEEKVEIKLHKHAKGEK